MENYNYRSFVKPDVAIQLRALGFNFECDYFYLNVNGKVGRIPNKWHKFPENWNASPSRMSCPTYSDAFKWFVEAKKMFPSVRISPIGVFTYEIWCSKNSNDWRMIAFSNTLAHTEIDKIHEDCLNRLIQIATKHEV